MTPPATAAAASPRLAPGSRRRTQTRARRVSGPAPSARAATAAAIAIPAPGVAVPRRQPAKPRHRPARKVARAKEPRGIALRVIDALEGVSSSSLLDRLIRGRLWIGLLAFSLIGIVAMQLLVLELNTGIGRKLARAAQLQLANAQLGIEDSGASAEARIDPLAAATGMTFAPSGSIHFVVSSSADVERAEAALSTTVKTPVVDTSESAPIGDGGASSSSQVAETTASGSETGAATTPSAAEGGSAEVSLEARETSIAPSGRTASSATASETSSGSQESATAPPTGAGGGVQAGVGE